MEKQKHIYVMISATYTKIARFIRYYTKADFNHTSISFDENMESLYSFCRIRHCMPLIGGLVRETLNRFTLKQPRKVKIKIFKIPVTEEQYKLGLDRIKEISEDDEYAYNVISVFTYFFLHGCANYKTYVCSEFVSHMLRLIRPDLAHEKPDHKVVPDDFQALLKDYEMYSGYLVDYDKFIDAENEEYFERIGKIKSLKMTYRFCKNRYWRYRPIENEE